MGGGLGKAGQDRKVAVVTCTLNLTHLSPADGPSLRLCACNDRIVCVCVSHSKGVYTQTLSRRADERTCLNIFPVLFLLLLVPFCFFAFVLGFF